MSNHARNSKINEIGGIEKGRMASKVLLIIPAYNEEENIKKTIEKVQDTEFDYVIVNDGSTDSTGAICRQNQFNVINLPVNLGIGGAVQTGYKYALINDYNYAVQIDGDGQHDPAYLDKMLEYMDTTRADMVIGSRFIEKKGFQSSLTRRMGIGFLSEIIKLVTGKRITDPTSGLRLIGRRAIARFAVEYPDDYPEPETTAMLLKSGLTIEEMPVIMYEREGGKSSISFLNSIYYMLKVTLAIIFVAAMRIEGEEE